MVGFIKNVYQGIMFSDPTEFGMYIANTLLCASVSRTTLLVDSQSASSMDEMPVYFLRCIMS